MKKITSLSMMLAAVLLAGCSANTAEPGQPASQGVQAQTTEESAPADELVTPTAQEPSGTVDTAEPETPETSEVPATAEASGEFALIGPGGDRVTAEELSRVDASDEADYLANGISATNWRQAEVSGFTYLAEPGGEYRRVRIGEEICGLTLFDADCVFDAGKEQQSGAHADECWFSSGFAEFEGTIQLSGTIAVAPEDIGLVEAGTVVFTPDEGTQLPVMNYLYSAEQGVYYPAEAMYPLIAVSGVTPQTDGERVTISLSGITMSSSVNSFSVVRGNAELAE